MFSEFTNTLKTMSRLKLLKSQMVASRIYIYVCVRVMMHVCEYT